MWYMIAFGFAAFGVAAIVHWWNLPRVVEARQQRAKVRQEERTKRVGIRRQFPLLGRLFSWRKKKDDTGNP